MEEMVREKNVDPDDRDDRRSQGPEEVIQARASRNERAFVKHRRHCTGISARPGANTRLAGQPGNGSSLIPTLERIRTSVPVRSLVPFMLPPVSPLSSSPP